MLNYANNLSDESEWIMCENINKALPFYVTELGRFKCNKNYFNERQNMPSYMLMLTLSGTGLLTYNSKTIQLKENSAVIIDCNEYYRYETNDTSWEFIWMYINGSGVKSFYDIFRASAYDAINVNMTGSVIQNFKYIEILSLRSDIVSSIQISNTISDILSNMLTTQLASQIRNSNASSHYSDIQTAIEYIHSNYQHNINLDDITERVNISKYHFIRLFKEQIGTTPYEYILNYRLLRAKKLLNTTNMSINEISINVGFSSPSNFIQKFKSLEGISPSSYRKKGLF